MIEKKEKGTDKSAPNNSVKNQRQDTKLNANILKLFNNLLLIMQKDLVYVTNPNEIKRIQSYQQSLNHLQFVVKKYPTTHFIVLQNMVRNIIIEGKNIERIPNEICIEITTKELYNIDNFNPFVYGK